MESRHCWIEQKITISNKLMKKLRYIQRLRAGIFDYKTLLNKKGISLKKKKLKYLSSQYIYYTHLKKRTRSNLP